MSSPLAQLRLKIAANDARLPSAETKGEILRAITELVSIGLRPRRGERVPGDLLRINARPFVVTYAQGNLTVGVTSRFNGLTGVVSKQAGLGLGHRESRDRGTSGGIARAARATSIFGILCRIPDACKQNTAHILVSVEPEI